MHSLTNKSRTSFPQLTAHEISARAYQIFLERGREPGHEKDDWLQAEYELLKLPVRKISELQAIHTITNGSELVNVVQAAVFLGEGI